MARRVLVGNIDDDRFDFAAAERLAHDRRELGVVDHDLGLAMIEDESNGIGVETDVDRIDYCARGRDAEQALVECRDIGCDDSDRVAMSDTALAQSGRESAAAAKRFHPCEAARAVDDSDPIGIDRGGPFQPAQWRQRHVVRRDLIEILFVWICGTVIHQAYLPVTELVLRQAVIRPSTPVAAFR